MKKVIFLGYNLQKFEYDDISEIDFSVFNIQIGDSAEIGDSAKIGNSAKMIKGNYFCCYGLYKYVTVAYVDEKGVPHVSLWCRNYPLSEWLKIIQDGNFWTDEFNGKDERSEQRMRAFETAKEFILQIKKSETL